MFARKLHTAFIASTLTLAACMSPGASSSTDNAGTGRKTDRTGDDVAPGSIFFTERAEGLDAALAAVFPQGNLIPFDVLGVRIGDAIPSDALPTVVNRLRDAAASLPECYALPAYEELDPQVELEGHPLG